MNIFRQSIRAKLLLGFLLVIAINLVGEFVLFEHNEEQLRFASESEHDIAVQVDIAEYLNRIREISAGIFMVAAGHEGTGQSAVLEAELACGVIERTLTKVDWQHFISDEQDFRRCVTLKNQLLEEASHVIELARQYREDFTLTEEGRARNRAEMRLALARATTLAEHANLYITQLTDEVQSHIRRNAATGQRTARQLRMTIFAIAIVVAFIALLVSHLLSRSLSNRIVELERSAEDFGRGDLSRRCDVSGYDEISRLAHTFNRMADDLQANMGLKLSKEYVENVVDTMTNGLLVIDGKGHIERVNRALCELMGHSSDQLIGRNVADIVPVHGEGVHNLEFELETGHGTITPVLVSSAPMTVDDELDAISREGRQNKTVCVIEDITKHKELIDELIAARQRAEDAALAKSQFLANMSHELRTPLNGILGYAQILEADKSLNDKQQLALGTMRQSGEHLLNLLDDILDLSKIEAGRMDIVSTEFHLPRFLGAIADVFRVRAQQKGIHFYFETLDELPTAVRGDAKRLRQVLNNLLGNAVKFTDTGGVIFKVGRREDSAGESSEDGAPAEGRSLIRFQVEDTGPGIEQADIDAIFAPFQQASGGRTRFVEGTGLGLSISRRLAEMMDGELRVRSVIGKGSVFWLDLELPEAENWSDPDGEALPSVIGYDGPRQRILIVDDKAENRSVLVSILSPLDFHVAETRNGKEALEFVPEFRPHLILMDVKMPVMDGLTATRKIRRLTRFARIPIIAVSASAFGEDRERSIDAGCDGFITKPLRFEELLEEIRRHLGLTWLHESAAAGQGPDESMSVPPSDTLQTLLDLALRGDIKGIRQELDRLEQAGDEHHVFIDKLRRMARLYRVKQIRQLLKKLSAEAEQSAGPGA